MVSPYFFCQLPRLVAGPIRPHGPAVRMVQPSAWPNRPHGSAVRMAKSCHPPSGIGARFATAEALASQRSNPAGIPSNSVAAPFPPFPLSPFPYFPSAPITPIIPIPSHHFSKKTHFFKKNPRNILSVQKKVVPLHSLSEKNLRASIEIDH